MENVFETLRQRGFIQQVTGDDELERILAERKVTFYIGFDPTADSLHVGHLLPIMAMAQMQRAGHRPIAIIGGGTAMVGDPSGKTEMRRILSREEIDANGASILGQLQRYVDFRDGRGLFVNNADWLLSLGYIDFLRDIGRHFRVNEMIKAESYRQRLEREEGLSFLEFNYQLLQAYDFLHLFQRHGCEVEMGGDDQWSNILAGVDLVRRVEANPVHGMTFPLLTTARGEKMGKTAKGAVWLSATRTSPYEFYQYWINTDDRDVARFLAYFTFLPMDEVHRLGALQDAALREAKEILACEATKLAHGVEAAEQARLASRAAFAPSGGGESDLSGIPTSVLALSRLEQGVPVVELFCEAGLTPSKAAARRLIEQGGAYINGEQVTAVDTVVDKNQIEADSLLLRYGKKRYHRVLVQ